MHFPFLKKKKTGTSSTIAQFRSPYLKKPAIPERATRKSKKTASILTPPVRLKAPKKSNKFLWFLFLIILLGIGIYAMFFSTFFHLQSWEAAEAGTRLEKNDPVNQILAAENGKNIFFLNQKNLIEKIKTIHPDIQKIEIKKILPQKIKVEFEKYPIAANIINVIGKTRKKLLIDTIGLIVDENNENPELPYIKIATAQALLLNTNAISEKRLKYILEAIRLFEEKFGMKILDSEYKIREREVHLRTEKFFTVWIDMEKKLSPQLEKLKKSLPTIDILNSPLEYIDLRISGTNNEKVIFKRRK